MRFRAGELEFTANVVDSSRAPSRQTGVVLQSLTIQFRAQKAGIHEAASSEAIVRRAGGLYSLGEGGDPEQEWRVLDSSFTYVGSEPWGINHHLWRVEQVERLACQLLRLRDVELSPYDYAESILSDSLHLAARALVTEAELDSISRLSGRLEVLRIGVSDTPRDMQLSGYVWGVRGDGLAVAVACEEIVEPRVTVNGYVGSDDLNDLVALLPIDAEELRRRRHARRRVADVDAWPLSSR